MNLQLRYVIHKIKKRRKIRRTMLTMRVVLKKLRAMRETCFLSTPLHRGPLCKNIALCNSANKRNFYREVVLNVLMLVAFILHLNINHSHAVYHTMQRTIETE